MQKKVLVLISNPEGTTPLNFPLEVRKLREAVERSKQRDRFTVELKFAATKADLQEHILDENPQIIHFCGHGSQEGLWLDNPDGKAELANNLFLTTLLKDFADCIECVVLNACHSAYLANELAQHINYVIGMNREVRDDAAIVFAKAFYYALGAGKPFERSFAAGKTAVLGMAASRGSDTRKAEVDQQSQTVAAQNSEHLIPVLRINPNPKPIKSFWLSPELERQALRELLGAIESGVNTIRLFHTHEEIILADQYIPVQVTLERLKPDKESRDERPGFYAEAEAELKRIYAIKGMGEEEIKRQQMDWQNARKQESRIVVLADPGMGKSTLLRREAGITIQQAYQALEQDRPLDETIVPFLIRLSSLADEIEDMAIEEAILKMMQERHSNLLKHHEQAEVMTFLNGFLKRQLLGGKGLLLLDALDEVPNEKRLKLLEKLNLFANDYPNCPIVGTSRVVGYGGRLVDGAKDMEIVPFSQRETEEYIRKWFKNAQNTLQDKQAKAQGLIQALRERPQLAGLAQNPLLLSLICSLFQHDRLTLPARRSQIYEQAVNCMLREWSQERPNYDKDLTEAKIRLLEALAYHFTCEEQEVFNYEDLYDWVENYLEEGNAPRDLRDAKTGELIAELSEQDGILQKLYRDKQDDQYLFLHRTFQEYFTASYLKRSIKKEKKNPSYVTKLVQTYCWNYDWHETLTLLAGMMKEPMQLIDAIVAQKDDIFQTQLLLAGQCLAECSELSNAKVDEIIDRIYEFWLAYPDAEFIRSVVVAIAQTSTQLLGNLQRTFTLANDGLKEYTIGLFGRIRTPLATEVLISILEKNNESLNVQRDAIRALANLRTPEAVKILIDSIKDNKEQDIRYTAVEALGQIRDPEVIEALTIVIAMDHDAEFRRRVVEVLIQINTPQALRAIISALGDSDHNVRIAASNAFRKVSVPKSLEAATVKALIPLLADKDSNVRPFAAFSLGAIGTPQAIKALSSVLKGQDINIRTTAAGILSKHGCSKATEILKSALQCEDVEVRLQAALRINANHPELLTASIAALDDEDWAVRSSIATALGKVNRVEAVDALISALEDPAASVRRSVTLSLGKNGKIKSTEVATALISTLNCEYDRLMTLDVETQSSFDNTSPSATSVASLIDNISFIIGTLGELGNSISLPALIHALLYTSKYIAISAAISLGEIRDCNAAPSLITALLSDQDSDVKREIAKALNTIAKENTLEQANILEQLLLLAGSHIHRPEVFFLARSWAVRFHKAGLPFIPIYPEVIGKSATGDSVEE